MSATANSTLRSVYLIDMSIFSELNRRNVIRVAAAYIAVSWLAIQVVETLFPLFGLSDAVARGVVIVLAVGFIPVLVLAWVFELTPEGLKRDSDVDRSAPGMRKLGKRFDRIVMLVLALALAYFAVDKFVIDPARDEERQKTARAEGRSEALVESYGEKSIAVLPFVNMSSDPEQEYFSDGISEELLNLLARIPELRVISRSSSFSFKGQDIEMPEIAHELNVTYILEGSVRKAGNRIRITAQLIEARSDTHLFSHSYDRNIGDIFDIQDEVAADVVARLKVSLLGEMPMVRRTDSEAYTLTMQAQHKRFSARPNEGFQVELLEKALAIDPDYVPALIELSLLMYHRRTDLDGRTEEWLRREYELLDHALAVAPDDPLVVAYNAWQLFEGKRDLESAATEFERAVRLAPNDVELLRATGAFARQIGQFEPAIKLFKRAFRLNPLCVTCSYLLANTYYRAQRFDEALEWQEKFMQAGEGGGYSLGRLRLFRGEPQAALAAFEGDRTSPDLVNAGRAMALFDLGRVEEAQKALAEQIEQWGETRPRYVALVYAWMGDVDSAIEWLYKVYGDEMKGFWRQVYNPIWRKLHGDPRWPALRERAGLSEERLSAIEFNPVLPD